MFTQHGKEEKKRPLVAALAALGLVLVGIFSTAPPATAESVGSEVTFTLSPGGLAISAPTATDLGTFGMASATVTGELGAVTVTDTRGAPISSWTATVGATDFITGTGGAGEAIPASAVAYVPGAATTEGLFTGDASLKVFAPAAVPGLSSSGSLVGAQVSIGSNSATWSPDLVVTVPQGIVAGEYTATITHSVTAMPFS